MFGGAPAEEEEVKPAAKPIVILDEDSKAKVESAHLPEPEKVLTEEEKAVSKAIASGDFSELEKEWENFTVKAMNPAEDDDDDDDDEDDEEEDEEEDEDDE